MMHLHKWAQWENRQCVDIYRGKSQTGKKRIQEQYCKVCGRLRARTVKLW